MISVVTISEAAGVDTEVSDVTAELTEDGETSVEDSEAGKDDPWAGGEDGAGVEPGRTDVSVDCAGAVWVSVAG
jgi:hypothetical protein